MSPSTPRKREPAPDQPQLQTDAKRRYEKPRLIDYGLVSKLTQGTATGSKTDGIMMMTCL